MALRQSAALAVACFVGAVVCFALLLGGCGPSRRPAMYGAELAACTETSATLAESLACEDRVRAEYGRPARDGGAR